MSKNTSWPPNGYFSAARYKSTPYGAFDDGSNLLANNKVGAVISFYHEPSGQSVFFKAFITAFNESYSSDWTSETVFGRADPIQHFKQTSRRISLGFKIPAATFSEAYENLAHVQELIQFLYPNYSDAGNTQTLSQNPFVRLKVMNLAQKSDPQTKNDASPTGKSNSAIYESYVSTADPSRGLLGTISNLNVVHNLDNPDIGVLQKAANTILPKMIEVNLDFTAIHEAQLGWNKDGKFATPNFPYGAISSKDLESPDRKSLGKDSTTTALERAKSEQAKEDALERWGTLNGEARMKKDLMYLNKMADKGYDNLNPGQQANVDYLMSAYRGASGQQDATLAHFQTSELETGAKHDEQSVKQYIKSGAEWLHDDFIK
tara:strand:+ start:134 stop:1258 length:1125 start_codon:yes stop_codon:yes gene_type:complete